MNSPDKPNAARTSRRLAMIGILFAQITAGSAWATDFYVAPNGSASGNGTLEQPWDLHTALDHTTNIVVGGDTLWLRGGIYRQNNQPTLFQSSLSGNPDVPITVRQLPGERAIIDGNITQDAGGWVNYWGFEIMNSHPARITSETGSFPTAFKVVQNGQTNDLCVSGFDCRAPYIKLINIAIHDSIGGGIGANVEAIGPDFSGLLSFYNGWQGCDRGHGHGLYVQNRDPSFFINQDCLFFSNYGFGIQATSTDGLTDNLFFEGNVLFSNGDIARKHQGNLLLGPFTGQANNVYLMHTYLYDTKGTGADVNIGYEGGANNSVLYDNYFQTRVHFSPSNQNMTVVMNYFLDGTSLNSEEFPDNFYPSNSPESNLVLVRPNLYEGGRAHIIVYNWENAATVDVDVSMIVPQDSEFEVRSAQDFFGPPVIRGTYVGEPIPLPMTNLLVAKPIGSNAPPSTAPAFNVFVVLPVVDPMAGTASNGPPTISFIGNQTVSQNGVTGPILFTVRDPETPPEFLTLSVSSSRPDLVPNPNLIFSGGGSNRTLRIQPVTQGTGSTTIKLVVSDGFRSASNVFSLTVGSSAGPKQIVNSGAAVLTIGTNQTPLLSIRGPAETEYNVQASTNLIDWSEIGKILTDCTGVGLLSDVSSNLRMRFYRFQTNQEALFYRPPK